MKIQYQNHQAFILLIYGLENSTILTTSMKTVKVVLIVSSFLPLSR